VREQEVVVLGEEPGRRRRVGVGTGGVGQVEELAPALVSERAKPRTEPLDHLPEPGQARPGSDVGDGRRPEGCEVAHDDLVERGAGSERTAEPGLGGGRRDLGRGAPDAAGRNLHECQQVAARVGESGGVRVGKALHKRGPQLRPGARALGHERPHERQRRGDVEPAERGRVLPMPGELSVEHGLHERAQHQAVVGADEMERGAHGDDADDAPLEQQRRELLRTEMIEPRPQRRVRVQRDLRLQTDEVLDRVEHRQGRPAEQQLALQRRSVQRLQAENLRAHRPDSRRTCGWCGRVYKWGRVG